jgi:hypothetical protein
MNITSIIDISLTIKLLKLAIHLLLIHSETDKYKICITLTKGLTKPVTFNTNM